MKINKENKQNLLKFDENRKNILKRRFKFYLGMNDFDLYFKVEERLNPLYSLIKFLIIIIFYELIAVI